MGLLATGTFAGYDDKEAHKVLEHRASLERRQSRVEADDWVFQWLCQRFINGKETLASIVERFAWINSKELGIVIVRLHWEQKVVLDYIEECWRENKPCEILLLKCRQTGMSTIIQIAFTILQSIIPNTRSLTMAHKDEAVDYLQGQIAKFAFDHMQYKPNAKTTRKRIRWANGSESMTESAESYEPGRAFNFKLIHLSEAAMYRNDYALIAGLSSTLPEEGFYVLVQETTAQGAGGQFYDVWVASQQDPPGNDYWAQFFAWYTHSRYQMPITGREKKELRKTLTAEEKEGHEVFEWTWEQIKWRRHRINTRYSGSVDLFHQEMPTTWEEAFLTGGRPVFDRKVLLYDQKRLQSVSPVFRGVISMASQD